MNHSLHPAALLTAVGLFLTAASAGATAAMHGATAPSSRVSSNSFTDSSQAFRIAVGKMNRGDTKGAEADLKVLVSNPNLATARPRFNYGVHVALAYCQQSNHEFEPAYENAIAAGEIEPAARNRDYWYLLMRAAQATQRDYVAIESLLHMLLSDPEHANDVEVSTIWSAYDTTAEMHDGGTHRRLLLEALWQVKYAPKDTFELPSTQRWWTDLYQSYVDIGNDNDARAVLGEIRDPYQVVRLRADNRYRRLISDDSRFDDIGAVSQRYLQWLNDQMTAHARQIGIVEEVARALMMSDRLPEALQLLDDTLAKVANAPKGRPAFDDLPDNLRWVMDTRARVLARLGRWDAVLYAQQAVLNDAPIPNYDVVSQRINLGDYLYRLNRPREALGQVKDVSASNASAYGMMYGPALWQSLAIAHRFTRRLLPCFPSATWMRTRCATHSFAPMTRTNWRQSSLRGCATIGLATRSWRPIKTICRRLTQHHMTSYCHGGLDVSSRGRVCVRRSPNTVWWSITLCSPPTTDRSTKLTCTDPNSGKRASLLDR